MDKREHEQTLLNLAIIMATNNNPHFFYHFPLYEETMLENRLLYGSFIVFFGGFLVMLIGYLIDFQKKFSFIFGFSSLGLALILSGISHSLKERRIAKAEKNEMPKFVKTVQTIITKTEIIDLNPDDEILLSTLSPSGSQV